jgi:hypothetical protein
LISLERGQISSTTVLERLAAVNLIESAHASCWPQTAILAARLCPTEKILLLAVKEWARQLGVASYDKVLIRDDAAGPPKVGTLLWDVSGPSYLRPMLRRDKEGKPKPGFLVCDVVLGGGEMTVQAVGAFVRKCQLLGGFDRMGASAAKWRLANPDQGGRYRRATPRSNRRAV